MDKERMDREGWKLASTSSGEHLGRILEMYRELGFEVYTEEETPETLEECGECTKCYLAGGETAFRVYTRGKARDEGAT